MRFKTYKANLRYMWYDAVKEKYFMDKRHVINNHNKFIYARVKVPFNDLLVMARIYGYYLRKYHHNTHTDVIYVYGVKFSYQKYTEFIVALLTYIPKNTEFQVYSPLFYTDMVNFRKTIKFSYNRGARLAWINKKGTNP